MIGRRFRGRKWLVTAAAIAAVIAAGWAAVHLSQLARIGAGYAAQQTCACLFVSGRALESCQMDLDPLARRLVSLQPSGTEVKAIAMGVATATARYEKNFGCALED
jgi:hypothetical protein